MIDRKSSLIAAVALAGALFAGAAQAGGHVNWSINIGVPGPVYAEPGYYAPPPVYYAPPPAYYRPRPVVVYGPPAVVYRSGPPAIVGGSWQRHDRWDHRRDRWEHRRDRRDDRRDHDRRGHHGR